MTRGFGKILSVLVAVCVFGASASVAHADVLREGTWPDEPTVSLAIDGAPRAQAIEKLAEAAGWSLVAQDLGAGEVHVRVKDQAPSKVLELLLSDARYVARRDGNLVSISRDAATTAKPATSASAAVPAPSSTVPASPADALKQTKKGEDRIITGGGTVGPDEVVKGLFVWGDSAVVEGTVTADILAIGADVTLAKGAYVAGDVVAFGGSVDIANGAQIDGEVGVVGGTLRRGDQVQIKCSTCNDEPKTPEGKAAKFFGELLGRLTGMSLLWVFGAVLLALALRRVQLVEAEIAARPWRCLGVGAGSFFAVLVVMGTLVVTLIGIPIAVLAGLLAGLSAYVGVCVVMLTLGSVAFRKRTQNPYAHLALGCVVFLLIGSIPVIGALSWIAVVLIGFGALVATRGAGFVPPRRSKPDHDAVDGPPVAAGG